MRRLPRVLLQQAVLPQASLARIVSGCRMYCTHVEALPLWNDCGKKEAIWDSIGYILMPPVAIFGLRALLSSHVRCSHLSWAPAFDAFKGPRRQLRLFSRRQCSSEGALVFLLSSSSHCRAWAGCRQSTAASSLSAGVPALSMDSVLLDIIRQIHASPTRAVFYIAGGGLQALTWLLTVPGASNTVLESRVPYGGGKSMSEILGQEPKKFASTQTAMDMARSAYRQAAHLSSFGTAILGVSCTCALVTDRIKKGDHKVCIATHDGQTMQVYSLRLSKGARNRISEDGIASRLLLKALGEACGLQHQVQHLDLHLQPKQNGVAPSLGPTEIVQASQQNLGDPLEALHEGRISSVEFSGGHVVCDAPRGNCVYLPGSFNPLHEGHRKLLAAGCELAGQLQDGCFELSIGNPDKGLLPLDLVRQRVQQFVETGTPVVVTKAPLYTDKASLFAKSVFVVGYDTAIRLVMPKYYGGHTQMLLQLSALHHQGCKFLVAGRLGEDGAFLTLDSIDVPEELADKDLFEAIPEAAFREDISSTELRNSGKGLAS